MGEYDFSHIQEQLPYIERAISKKIVHPKYNFYTYEYDLALVRLDQPLEFAPHISPICLPATENLLIGENATLTGWGEKFINFIDKFFTFFLLARTIK